MGWRRNALMATLALGTLPASGLWRVTVLGFLLRYITCFPGYLVSGRESVRPWLVLFGTHLERGCQPPGWPSAEMWMLPLGSISHFPGWHVSLTSTGGGCWKTHKTHLHRMRGRVTTLETWRVWFSWRARHAVPSQQRLILETKIR